MNPMFALALLSAGGAAVVDYRTGHIPNPITLGALAAGVVGNSVLAATSDGVSAVPGAIATAVGGAILASIVPLILWRGRALGGGDVKLFAALGALLGPMLGLEAQLWTFGAAALLVPFHLAWKGELFATIFRGFGLAARLFVPSLRKKPVSEKAFTWVRLGPAIFAGTALAIFAGLRP